MGFCRISWGFNIIAKHAHESLCCSTGRSFRYWKLLINSLSDSGKIMRLGPEGRLAGTSESPKREIVSDLDQETTRLLQHPKLKPEAVTPPEVRMPLASTYLWRYTVQARFPPGHKELYLIRGSQVSFYVN